MNFQHWLLVIGFVGFAVANSTLPHNVVGGNCTDPVQRIEWRDLGVSDQQSYIKAVLCLKNKPSRIGLNTTLYDDFAYVHFKYASWIHGVAAFLPWHRFFTHVYEEALQECGYSGVATYWDWTRDVLRLLEAPVFYETAFGGDGSDEVLEHPANGGTLRCVIDGPFSGLRPAYRAITPSHLATEDHCLFRGLNDGELQASIYNSTNINIVQAVGTFADYSVELEGSPHGIIHSAIGGEMNPTTSPNEPLFFLHHAQIDRLWWLWQQNDLLNRVMDYSGFKRNLDLTEGIASLDDHLPMGGLVKDVRVRDVMSTRNGRLCYRY